MLSLWMYLLRNVYQISVLKYQEVVFRTIRALMMRREFFLGNLGWHATDGSDGPDPSKQRDDEAKVCRVYRKLLEIAMCAAISCLSFSLLPFSFFFMMFFHAQHVEGAEDERD